MNIKMTILFFLASLFFFACGKQAYIEENSAVIVFKTPTFKYADMGFIYENKDEIKVEIYGSGQALMSLKISENLICMTALKCMPKEYFNAKILSEDYPKNILDNVFRGKEIFDGKGLTKKSNGFTQKISKNSKVDIRYSVLNNEIIFQDTINKILLKILKR